MLAIRVFAAAFGSLLASTALAVQSTTGQIVGVVKDESGAVLGDALVSVDSAALQGGPASSPTNPKGAFRLLFLPPGEYSLAVTADGFQSYSEERIRVQIGATVERVLTLVLATVAEEVIVMGRGPIVDPRRVGTTVHYGSESIENLPRPRISVTDFLKMAPGISPWPAGAAGFQLGSFGSGVNENLVLVDGVNRTHVAFASGVPSLEMDSLQEIEIVTTGASAEFAFAQGAVFNVVTKQGGDTWRFDFSYYNQNEALTAASEKTRCRCPDGESGFMNNAYHDATTHLGGDLVPNRLWLFAGYQYRNQRSDLCGDGS